MKKLEESFQSVNKAKLAILFDLENLKPEEILEELISRLEKRFIVYPRKLIFNAVAQIKKSFLDNNIKPFQLDLVGAYAPVGKNVADFRLYIEALELLYTSKDMNFCIVSGDADYAELVIKLRHENRYVIGIGPKDKSKIEYVNLFNEFIYIEDLKNKKIEVEEKIVKKPTNQKTKKEVEEKKVKTTKKEKKTEKKVEPKQSSSKKVSKDNNFFDALKEFSDLIINEFKKKKQDIIHCSTIIKELKNRSPDYFGKAKISSKDFEKVGYKILHKEKNKPETAYINIK